LELYRQELAEHIQVAVSQAGLDRVEDIMGQKKITSYQAEIPNRSKKLWMARNVYVEL
jgi:hypothetical protein